ncbi:MAG: hypothetical protein PHX83_14565 [Acidobacteriia bacterium]|nr:hypothetical protein [Terriglobia bacterium]
MSLNTKTQAWIVTAVKSLAKGELPGPIAALLKPKPKTVETEGTETEPSGKEAPCTSTTT